LSQFSYDSDLLVQIFASYNVKGGRRNLDDMGLEEEWLSQILGKSTKKSYAKGIHHFLEFLGLGKCEELDSISKPETIVRARIKNSYIRRKN
jgi:hypothetical protein